VWWLHDFLKNALADLVGFGRVTVTMKKQSKATIKTPVKDLNVKETLDHRKIILLEDIQAKMEMVIEVTETTKESIHKEMSEFRSEVNQRFDMIENVVRAHSGQLQDIEKQLTGHGRQLTDHGKQLAELKSDVKEIKTTVKHLDEKFTEKVDDHETRITALETARL